MYDTFYQLTLDPFRLSPDHRLCYQHRSYKKAKAYMQYALHRSEGIVMITGGPGTGKTTLINDLLAGLDPARNTVARLGTTQLQGQDFLRSVAYAFDLHAEAVDQATLLRDIEQFLVQQHESERNVLLVVDEAQDLHPSSLTELRLLVNIQRGSQLLLQAFLLGQENLTKLVRSADMQQFHQRVIAACHLDPLSGDQTRRYVEHRLGRVGWQNDPLISDDAFALIHHYSQGVPRRINLICSRLFLHGCTEEKHNLERADMQLVIEELRREKLTPLDSGDTSNLEPIPAARAEPPPAPDAVPGSRPAAQPARRPVTRTAKPGQRRTAPVARPRAPQPPAAPQLPQHVDDKTLELPRDAIVEELAATRAAEPPVAGGAERPADSATPRPETPPPKCPADAAKAVAVAAAKTGATPRKRGLKVGGVRSWAIGLVTAGALAGVLALSTGSRDEAEVVAAHDALGTAGARDPRPVATDDPAEAIALARDSGPEGSTRQGRDHNPAPETHQANTEVAARGTALPAATKAYRRGQWQDGLWTGEPGDDSRGVLAPGLMSEELADWPDQGDLQQPSFTEVDGGSNQSPALTLDANARVTVASAGDALAEPRYVGAQAAATESRAQRSSDQRPALLEELRAHFSDLEELADERIRLSLGGDALFDMGRSELKEDAHASLDRLADTLVEQRGVRLRIVGHTARSPRNTASTLADTLNLALSRQRAEVVASYLVARGVPDSQIRAEGRGGAEPVAANDNPTNRRRNRRVDIFIATSAESTREPSNMVLSE